MKKLIYISLIVFINSFYLLSQANTQPSQTLTKLDSLFISLKKEKVDTTKVKLLNDLAWEFKGIDPDTAIIISNQALELATKLQSSLTEAIAFTAKRSVGLAHHQLGAFNMSKGEFEISLKHYNDALTVWDELLASSNKIYSNAGKKGKSNTIGNIGNVYAVKGELGKAQEFFFKALKLSEETNSKADIARHSGNIANIFNYQGDYPKALEFFFKAMKLNEELGNKNLAANIGDIGSVYARQGEYKKALEYYFKAVKMNEDLGNKNGISSNYNNIGNVYNYQNDFKTALSYYFKVLEMHKEGGANKRDLLSSLGNIGIIYHMQGEEELKKGNVELARKELYPKAIEYYFNALELSKKVNDKRSEGLNLSNIGSLYTRMGKFKESEQYLKEALLISEELESNDQTGEIEKFLTKLYDTTGRTALAYSHYKKYIALRDTINSKENQKLMVRTEMNYEFEKKELTAKTEQEKKDALAAEEKQKQKLVLFFVIGGLLLVIIFSAFLYNRFRITNKQKKIIEHQKHLVEEHQKEILDSITYAKRLQEAILPPVEMIKKHMPDSFVLYKPKDIVAGDFYWMEVINTTIFIAAADCTGHGVPGAMVSVVCSNALNRTVKEFNLTKTGEILDKTRELVLQTFEKSTSEVKDGMDISIMSIDTKNKKICWSGANNPLWYIEQGENEAILHELKADKQPIGKADHATAFTTHEIKYKENTLFYLFTDGLADQFGGPKGKKFKYKQLSDLLVKDNALPLKQQAENIENAFENWKGNLEQVDDVCVIGIKI